MFRHGWVCPTLTLLLAAAPPARAQASAASAAAQPDVGDNSKFKLGEVTVTVTDTLDPLETAHTKLEADRIQERDKDTVSAALELLPGISTSIGTRNESMIYVRGFDSRQVPLFIDGIPSYVPYDGQMDYNRFTTFDLSEIQVAKGFSSVTYGANTLGGAINLVTRRPTEKLEGDLRLGFFEGEGRKAAVNFGTNQGLWYLQAGASYTKADWWPLSSAFKSNANEDGGHRTNSDFTDKRYSLKLGFTPNDTDEYVIGATRQTGEKGQPPTVDPRFFKFDMKYWRWPAWDKDSLFLATRTALGDKSYVKFSAYFETYENSLYNYADGTYAHLSTKGWQKSYYDDFSHGAKVEFGTMLLPRQNLKVVLDSKTDVHREGDGSTASTAKWPHYEDRYLNWGIEDTLSLPANVDLVLGIGQDHLKPIESGPTWGLTDPKSFFHAQAGLFWRVVPSTQLYLTFAQKEHFATLKDRYSTKFNQYDANPGLKPERSENWELGVKSTPAEWVELSAALFQSNIRDLIQSGPSDETSGKLKMLNIGKVEHSGVELSADFKPCSTLRTGLAYTYLDRSNKSDPDTRLTGTPRHRGTGYVRWAPVERFYVLASLQAQDGLWDTYTYSLSKTKKVTETAKLGGFTTVDLTLGWKPTPQVAVDGGCTNLLDRNYALSDGYPLPGRMWFVNGRYRF